MLKRAGLPVNAPVSAELPLAAPSNNVISMNQFDQQRIPFVVIVSISSEMAFIEGR
jgi:uncharacterized membrane protein YfbV (UPF0208 family)